MWVTDEILDLFAFNLSILNDLFFSHILNTSSAIKVLGANFAKVQRY